MSSDGPSRLLTFRLDTERRKRLKARLSREGRTMSEVVTHGLRQYVQHARHGEAAAAVKTAPQMVSGALVLPDRVAARLRELRSSGSSELLSATLAALHEAGWPLRPLAQALGISRQAVQRRVRRRPRPSCAGTSSRATRRRHSRSGAGPAATACARI